MRECEADRRPSARWVGCGGEQGSIARSGCSRNRVRVQGTRSLTRMIATLLSSSGSVPESRPAGADWIVSARVEASASGLRYSALPYLVLPYFRTLSRGALAHGDAVLLCPRAGTATRCGTIRRIGFTAHPAETPAPHCDAILAQSEEKPASDAHARPRCATRRPRTTYGVMRRPCMPSCFPRDRCRNAGCAAPGGVHECACHGTLLVWRSARCTAPPRSWGAACVSPIRGETR